MTGRWGSPNDRVLGRLVGAGFLALVAVSTLVPAAERVLNTVALGLLAVAVLALVVAAVAFLVKYIAGERAIAWECVRPLGVSAMADIDLRRARDASRPYTAKTVEPEVTR